MPDIDLLLKRLIDHKVEFVIVGGFAAVTHGAALMTQDVDVACRFSPVNLLRLQAAQSDLHPFHRMTPSHLPLKLTRAKCRGLKNLYLATDWGQLDCLGEVLGLGGYDEVKKQSVVLSLEIGQCRVLSLDALIRAKKAMGRPRDHEAVRQLEAIRERTRRAPGTRTETPTATSAFAGAWLGVRRRISRAAARRVGVGGRSPLSGRACRETAVR